MKKVPMTKTVTWDVYEAIDGTKFDSERECKIYEENIERIKKFNEIDRKYRDTILDDMIPLNYEACYSDFSTYRWYEVSNKKELEEISEAYNEPIREKITEFPTWICMETEDKNYNGQVYQYTLDQAKKVARQFFDNFGIKVEFH